jgi:hypothetical protein
MASAFVSVSAAVSRLFLLSYTIASASVSVSFCSCFSSMFCCPAMVLDFIYVSATVSHLFFAVLQCFRFCFCFCNCFSSIFCCTAIASAFVYVSAAVSRLFFAVLQWF